MITAKIIKDSLSPAGKRITSFELEFPRFVLAEFNTHRMISRNSASSRAIPIDKMIENIQNNPAMPVWWGKNQSGMQAKEELSNSDELRIYDIDSTVGGSVKCSTRSACQIRWIEARDKAIEYAKELSHLGLHKQIVNRILEPWVITKVIATATDWDNFFYLRNHEDAQPEIHELARLMCEEYKWNRPDRLSYGEWHLPYITTKWWDFEREREDLFQTTNSSKARYFSNEEELSLENAQKISASLCAQVSYRKTDESLDKAIKIFDRLILSKPAHSSPMEHQGTPLEDPKAVSGNFRGWLQFRHTIPNNTCEKYFEKTA